MARHSLDPWSIPKEKLPLYINEPWLIDPSLMWDSTNSQDDLQKDNIRVYIPLDINREAVLRRIKIIIARYGEANEDNEMGSGKRIFGFRVISLKRKIEISERLKPRNLFLFLFAKRLSV